MFIQDYWKEATPMGKNASQRQRKQLFELNLADIP
jgi:hypothetical protein